MAGKVVGLEFEIIPTLESYFFNDSDGVNWSAELDFVTGFT